MRSKAALLLSCDPSALKIASSQPGRYSAQGCGKNIDYECESGTDCCAFERPGVRGLEEISAATSRAPVAPEPLVKPDSSSSDPTVLSKRLIREIIGQQIDEVRSCYAAELGDPPSVTGIVQVKFIISPKGRVQTAALESSSLGRQRAETCIVNLVQTWTFPPPEGGGIVVVTYPFVLGTPPPHTACR